MKTKAQIQRDGNPWPFRIFILIVVLLFVAFSTCHDLHAQGREKPKPTIYALIQPTDLGIGLRGDYHINPWAGLYGSASYGQWRLYDWSGLDKHVKATLGILIPLRDYRENQHDLTIGVNYHWISGEVEPSEIFRDAPIFHSPWSFEVGFTVKFKRFALGMRTDILRWEPCLDLGFPIRKRKL